MFATDSSTPHTFSVFKYFALALLCPWESWSPTSTAKPVGLAVSVAETCSAECTLCAQYTQPYTILPTRFSPSACILAPLLPRAPPPRHNLGPSARASAQSYIKHQIEWYGFGVERLRIYVLPKTRAKRRSGSGVVRNFLRGAPEFFFSRGAGGCLA